MLDRMKRIGGFRDAWIPWIFVGMFVVVISVNGIMITVAFDSWTGLSTDNAYEEGLAYNERIAAAEAQAALDWQVAMTAEPLAEQRVRVALTLRDAAGEPFRADEVRATFIRPTQEGHDMTVWLAPGTAPGEHVAEVAVPLKGVWDVHVEARERGDTFRIEKRVTVAP